MDKGFKVKLDKDQKKALRFFKKNNYVVVESPRRRGKTVFLYEIIKKNPDKIIGIRCLSYAFFKQYYRQFENCRYFEGEDDFGFNIIIGDEILVPPNGRIPTACALTKKYITLRWKMSDNPYVDKKQLKQIKKEMSKETYNLNFGQYK